jgi:predicted dinucleotide-binding enzyme
MRLAIIGAGNVGGTLGTAWVQKADHEIFFGVRNRPNANCGAKAWREGSSRYTCTSRSIRRIHCLDHAMECSRSGNPLQAWATGASVFKTRPALATWPIPPFAASNQ